MLRLPDSGDSCLRNFLTSSSARIAATSGAGKTTNRWRRIRRLVGRSISSVWNCLGWRCQVLDSRHNPATAVERIFSGPLLYFNGFAIEWSKGGRWLFWQNWFGYFKYLSKSRVASWLVYPNSRICDHQNEVEKPKLKFSITMQWEFICRH